MALDPTLENPCSVLNALAYPTLWVNSTTPGSDAWPRIASAGNIRSYVATLNTLKPNGGLDSAILTANSSNQNSNFRLIQFLSEGGVAQTDTTKNYSKLSDVILKNSSGAIEGIVENYLAPKSTGGASAYTYSKPDNVLVNAAKITIILDELMNAGYLLKSTQIYRSPGQAQGTKTLLDFFSLEQEGTISPEDRAMRIKLEATNLRFFGAFLAEYCFYRTRYEWLLSKYFTIYTTNTMYSALTSVGASSPIGSIGIRGAELAQLTPTSGTQVADLANIAYQLACLNTRMTDMRTLLGAVNTYYSSAFTQIQTTINSNSAAGSNVDVTNKILALKVSAGEASTYLTEQDFRQQAMEYNSQKNRYANILLGLYAFLNIAGLATVFQLARS